MASSTVPAPSGADTVRATKDPCRNVVEVVVPILHDTLRAATEAANAYVDDKLAHLQIEDIPILKSRLDGQDEQIAAARADSFVYAFLFG